MADLRALSYKEPWVQRRWQWGTLCMRIALKYAAPIVFVQSEPNLNRRIQQAASGGKVEALLREAVAEDLANALTLSAALDRLRVLHKQGQQPPAEKDQS